MTAAAPQIAVIAAVARNGTIGHDNALLWRLPEDLQRFKRLTQGSAVVMGRKTWDSLPAAFRPLPGRLNIVVTRNAAWRAEGAVAVGSLDAALDAARAGAQAASTIWIIGGGELYAQALPRADLVALTELDRDYAGDTRFPRWPRDDFVETERETRRTPPPDDLHYAFVTYCRRPRGDHDHVR